MYVQIHTWADRAYNLRDPDCNFKYNYVKYNFPDEENSFQSFAGVYQIIREM